MDVLIVGGGKVGAYLTELLLSQGHRPRLMECAAGALERLRRDLPPEVLFEGSGADPASLEECGIRRAAVVAAVTGADETNLVVTSLARFEYGAPRTIARVNSPKNAWMFIPAMGVDVALSQADLMAHLIVEEMALGDMTTLLKLRRGQYSLMEEQIPADSPAVGRSVAALKLPENCALVALIRQGQVLIPQSQTVLQAEDEVLAIVHSAQATRLAAILGQAPQREG